MKLLKLIVKNAFRHRLRTILTILGLAITIMSFGIVRNVLEVFSFSEDDLIPGHLITRHKTSMMQFLPYSHLDKMRQVEGVEAVTYGFWMGVRYGDDPEEFFARMAIDQDNFYKIRSDWITSEEDIEDFKTVKNAALITPALALKKDWEEGDVITVGCDYFETVSLDVEIVGQFEFAQEQNRQAEFMLVRGDLFRRAIGQEVSPEMEHQVGWIELLADPPDEATEIATRVDSLFMNSDMETKTEPVNAYANAQVERFRTIITALQVSSYLMIGVILLVLLNTMSMVARERINENAVLKTLGFRGKHLVILNFGESMFVALIGAVLGAALIWPGIKLFKTLMPFLQQVKFEWITVVWVIPAMIIVGILASLVPVIKATNTSIVDGLRTLE
ncbi:MAG: FtsX-like permease family protein [candidate division Zixibacteria bacterium]|nr:FtsX-like permease family protein [candidate division Zixibacteria bacterium]